jgi:hypothetical protein
MYQHSPDRRRNSFQPPIITLGAALYDAYQTRKEKRASASMQDIGRSGGKYAAVPFEGRTEEDYRQDFAAAMEGFAAEEKGKRGEGDVPPPDYEDVVRESRQFSGCAALEVDTTRKKNERDGGDSFDLRDDEEGREFLAAVGGHYDVVDDDEEIVGGGRKGSATGVKMGFFERVRARKEAKRRAWLEKRAERGGGRGGPGFGFGCRGGRRGGCM